MFNYETNSNLKLSPSPYNISKGKRKNCLKCLE